MLEVAVVARVSEKLKEALGLYAERLERVAVRPFLRQPGISGIVYELVEVSKRFPGRKELMSVALGPEEARRLRELAAHHRRSLSEILTLALAHVLSEPHDTVLEEACRMSPRRPMRAP